MNLTLLLSKLGISTSLSRDITFLLIVALASFLFGMFIGRYRLITVLINIYVSYSLLQVVPESYLSGYTNQIIFFFALLIILTIVSKRFFDISLSGAGTGFLWRVFAMSFLEVMLMASITLSILPARIALDYVSSAALDWLSSENARIFWMAAPLAFMFFIYKKINR